MDAVDAAHSINCNNVPTRFLLRVQVQQVRAPSPTVHLHSGSPTSSMGTGSPGRGREMSLKKKKGLLSKGKKLLKKLGAVK